MEHQHGGFFKIVIGTNTDDRQRFFASVDKARGQLDSHVIGYGSLNKSVEIHLAAKEAKGFSVYEAVMFFLTELEPATLIECPWEHLFATTVMLGEF